MTEHTLYVHVNDRLRRGGRPYGDSALQGLRGLHDLVHQADTRLCFCSSLWCDSQVEREQEGKIEGGRPGRGKGGGNWHVRRNSTVSVEEKTPMTSRKSRVNKCVSEITNRARGGEIVRDKQ